MTKSAVRLKWDLTVSSLLFISPHDDAIWCLFSCPPNAPSVHSLYKTKSLPLLLRQTGWRERNILISYFCLCSSSYQSCPMSTLYIYCMWKNVKAEMSSFVKLYLVCGTRGTRVINHDYWCVLKFKFKTIYNIYLVQKTQINEDGNLSPVPPIVQKQSR